MKRRRERGAKNESRRVSCTSFFEERVFSALTSSNDSMGVIPDRPRIDDRVESGVGDEFDVWRVERGWERREEKEGGRLGRGQVPK